MDEGTEVQFQVRAENEAGVGHPSEPTEILTIEDPTSKLVVIAFYLVRYSNKSQNKYICCTLFFSKVHHLLLLIWLFPTQAGSIFPSPGRSQQRMEAAILLDTMLKFLKLAQKSG